VAKGEFAMIIFLVEHQRNKKCSWEHKSLKVSETETKLNRRPLIIEDGPLCLSVTQTLYWYWPKTNVKLSLTYCYTFLCVPLSELGVQKIASLSRHEVRRYLFCFIFIILFMSRGVSVTDFVRSYASHINV
jgi:hypothetical protein